MASVPVCVHIALAQMLDEPDARRILTASTLDDWRRPPECPRAMWFQTIQQDLKSNNLSLNEAIDMTHKQPQIAEIVVCVWSYVLLVVHARKEDNPKL